MFNLLLKCLFTSAMLAGLLPGMGDVAQQSNACTGLLGTHYCCTAFANTDIAIAESPHKACVLHLLPCRTSFVMSMTHTVPGLS
jgi:hypothetical protein